MAARARAPKPRRAAASEQADRRAIGDFAARILAEVPGLRTRELKRHLTPLLDPALKDPELRNELAFHSAEILEDFLKVLPHLARPRRGTRKALQSFLWGINIHWPYHQRELKKVERRIEKSLEQGLPRRPRRAR